MDLHSDCGLLNGDRIPVPGKPVVEPVDFVIMHAGKDIGEKAWGRCLSNELSANFMRRR